MTSLPFEIASITAFLGRVFLCVLGDSAFHPICFSSPQKTAALRDPHEWRFLISRSAQAHG